MNNATGNRSGWQRMPAWLIVWIRTLGGILKRLNESGLSENTIVMFCSDNGACPFERTRGKEFRPWDPRSYWTYDVGWAHVGNTPFRWYKQNQHEGGITSPMIVSWPGD